MSEKQKNKKSLIAHAKDMLNFCLHGVWNDETHTSVGNIIKAANLAVRRFLDDELQQRACALTYRTVLAIVPALAMLFAIGRGFGFQNLIQGELMRYFPAQQEALSKAMEFVDNYLKHASEGMFVGIGIVFLLWTLISLMNNVERSFNKIWGVEKERPFYRKFTDYTALFILLPILMICSAGISIFMSTTVQEALPVNFSPFVQVLLDVMPIVLVWLMFAAAYWLVPHTTVKLKYAIISGIVFGSLFYLVQWVFVNAEVWLSSYNAIYGSFAFLPLLLLWFQIVWVLTLSGVIMTYTLQNIYGFHYSYHDDVRHISISYYRELSIMVLAMIVKRFEKGEKPVNKSELMSKEYNIPITLLSTITARLVQAGLISQVKTDKETEEAYQPAFAINSMTVEVANERLNKLGSNHFISKADEKFHKGYARLAKADSETLIKDLL